MVKKNEKFTGYIRLVFFDQKTNQVIILGGGGFTDSESEVKAWASVPIFEGESNFMADRLDDNMDILDEKPVSAEVCEYILGKPIAELIASGRIHLNEFLASLPRPGVTH